MRDLIKTILEHLSKDESVVLSIIIESMGSTPRKSGSVMAVFENGSGVGTIGGGALEYEAQKVSADMLSGADPAISQTIGYSLSSDETGDLCMICGGDVIVHYTKLSPTAETKELFRGCADHVIRGSDIWMAFDIADGKETVLSLHARGDAGNSVAHLLIKNEASDDHDLKRYIIPLSPQGRVIIFGGGHIGKALIPILTSVGFECLIYEDREEYADPERFSGASVILGDFKDLSKNINFVPSDYVVIVTRGHKNDYDVITQTLPLGLRYVGCIGSRRKMAIQRQKLQEECGFSDELVAKLVNPIGVDIGAETPEEIAISIAGELIMVRAGGKKGYKK